MSRSGAGTCVETLSGSGATIEQAGRAMKHLEALLRAGTETAIAGPAEIYYALGVCRQIMAAWQHSASHLEAWLIDQSDRGCLAVTDGPFANDPAAAVATTVAALQDTHRACLDLQAGLERAQMALTAVSAPLPIPQCSRTWTKTNRWFPRDR